MFLRLVVVFLRSRLRGQARALGHRAVADGLEPAFVQQLDGGGDQQG